MPSFSTSHIANILNTWPKTVRWGTICCFPVCGSENTENLHNHQAESKSVLVSKEVKGGHFPNLTVGPVKLQRPQHWECHGDRLNILHTLTYTLWCPLLPLPQLIYIFILSHHKQLWKLQGLVLNCFSISTLYSLKIYWWYLCSSDAVHHHGLTWSHGEGGQ